MCLSLLNLGLLPPFRQNLSGDWFLIVLHFKRGLSFLQLQFCLDPEPIAVNCTAFNHNGNLLVTGAADGVIRLFGKRVCSRQSWSPPPSAQGRELGFCQRD